MFYKLMSGFISYMYYIMSHKVRYINSSSLVKKIHKVSLMGNIIDVTLQFIAQENFIHVLDTWIVITYVYNNTEYKLGIEPCYYKEAIQYIENLQDTHKSVSPRKTIHSAFLVSSNATLPINITNQVTKYAGPSLNFYTDTPFPTTTKLLLEFEFMNDKSIDYDISCENDASINVLEYSKEKGMILHTQLEDLHTSSACQIDAGTKTS